MNILFVSSGNSKNVVDPIMQNQGDSLAPFGHQVSHFTIKGKGIIGYLRNVFILRSYLKNKSFDIIHAHYSLSAYVSSFAGASPIVTSLMGSDVKASHSSKYIIKLFAFLSWKAIIVKSKDMRDSSNFSKAYIIPNGVNLDKFKSIDKTIALKITQWNVNKKHVLFASNPARREKNFKLANEAFNLLEDKNIELHTLIDIPNNLIPYYLNAADVVLLTSLWEGSPNIIKEAMACNIPVLGTDVGDIKELIDNVDGCFVTSFEPKDIAEKLKMALVIGKSINGREKITELGLNSDSVATNLISIYKKILSNQS